MGWGDGLVDKVLTAHIWELELSFQAPMQVQAGVTTQKSQNMEEETGHSWNKLPN